MSTCVKRTFSDPYCNFRVREGPEEWIGVYRPFFRNIWNECLTWFGWRFLLTQFLVLFLLLILLILFRLTFSFSSFNFRVVPLWFSKLLYLPPFLWWVREDNPTKGCLLKDCLNQRKTRKIYFVYHKPILATRKNGMEKYLKASGISL